MGAIASQDRVRPEGFRRGGRTSGGAGLVRWGLTCSRFLFQVSETISLFPFLDFFCSFFFFLFSFFLSEGLYACTRTRTYGLSAHYITLHHTIPHHITPYHTTPHETHITSYHITPHHTTPLHTLPYHTKSNHTASYHTILNHNTPHQTHTTSYHTTSHHTTPPHTTSHHPTLHAHGESLSLDKISLTSYQTNESHHKRNC